MNKNEFLKILRRNLKELPVSEVEERVLFYSEIIDDKVEEGFSEDDVIAEIGEPEALAKSILGEYPEYKKGKDKNKTHKLSALEIVLLSLGSPVWVSLFVAALAVVISLYIVIWSVVISFWAAQVSLAVCAFAALFLSVCFFVCGNTATGFAALGASMVLAGLSIFLFFTCTALSKAVVMMTKLIFVKIKNRKKKGCESDE